MKRILIIGMVVLLGGLITVIPPLVGIENGNGDAAAQAEYPTPKGVAKGFDRTATSPPYGKAHGHDSRTDAAPADAAPADAAPAEGQDKGQGKGGGKG